MDQDQPEGPREPVLDALRALDREAFSYVVGMIWQQSKHAGGFHDKQGWYRVRGVTETYLQLPRQEG